VELVLPTLLPVVLGNRVNLGAWDRAGCDHLVHLD
jgi:hypothetical protein